MPLKVTRKLQLVQNIAAQFLSAAPTSAYNTNFERTALVANIYRDVHSGSEVHKDKLTDVLVALADVILGLLNSCGFHY